MHKSTNFVILDNDILNNSLISKEIYKQQYINHQINNILKIHKQAKVIVIGPCENITTIKNKKVRYVHHALEPMTNTGEMLQEIIPYINDNISLAIMNASMFFDPVIMSTIDMKKSSMIINRYKKFESKIGCTIVNNKIDFVFYDLNNKLCEFLYIHKKDIPKLKHVISDQVSKRMYLFEIINILINNQMDIYPYMINKNIIHFRQNNMHQIRKHIRKASNVLV